MKKLIYFILLFPNICFSNLGIIRVDIVCSENNSSRLNIYSNCNTSSDKHELILKYSLKNNSGLLPSFDSIVFKDFEFSPLFIKNRGCEVNLYFRYSEQKDDWYKIIINEKKDKYLWIQNKEIAEVYNFKSFTKKHSVIILEFTDNNIFFYKKKNKLPSQISTKELNCFEIVKVKKNWMKVDSYCDLCSKENLSKKRILGWVKINFQNQLNFHIIDIL